MQETVIINQIPYNLEDILQDCWHRLINGTNSAKHPFNCPSIATINGVFPEIRTVVLRKVIPAESTLIFYSDYRSPKINQIKINNSIAWLFYDSKSRIQLRLTTVATIHHQDEITLKRWVDSRVESRKIYTVYPAPSTITPSPTDGLPEIILNKDLTEETVTIGYENFSVIKNKVMAIDWLFLNHDGHRRAKFILGENEIEKYWLVP